MSFRGSLRKVRRQLKRFTATRRIVSFGGVGSSSLVRHLEGGDGDRIWYHSRDKHCLAPELLPEVRAGLEVRACFLYGDPFHSVLSVFRRGLHVRHERSMSRSIPGYRPVLRKSTSVADYLAEGEDRFFLHQHLDSWLGYEGRRVRILAVKYEALGDHIAEILEFLECPRPFEVRPRTSRYEEQPPEIREGLERMYGDLRRRIQGLSSLTRVDRTGL